MANVTVALIDDHYVVREGIRSMLEKASDIEVVWAAGFLEEARLYLARAVPDVVVLDVLLSHGENGLDFLPELRRCLPTPKVLVLSAMLSPSVLHRCMEENVAGYLTKDTENFDLAAAVRMVATGGHVYDPRAVESMERYRAFGFTPSEQRVLSLVGTGMSNAEIAQELGSTEGAVKRHVSSCMAKMGVQNRVALVLKAKDIGTV